MAHARIVLPIREPIYLHRCKVGEYVELMYVLTDKSSLRMARAPSVQHIREQLKMAETALQIHAMIWRCSCRTALASIVGLIPDLRMEERAAELMFAMNSRS